MKQLLLFFGLLISATIINAQAPQAFNYQAVIRDASGQIITGQNVGVQISLLQGSASSEAIYTETHATATNTFGQINLAIGTGTVVTGQFDTIPWAADNYFVQLAVDITGGANYEVVGASQLLSVPYALHAEEGSGWEKTEGGISYLDGKVGIGTTTPSKKLEINGSININAPSDAYVGLFQNNNVNLTLGGTSGSQPRIYLYGSASPTNPGKISILTPGNITLGSNSGSEPRIYFYSSLSPTSPGSLYIAAPGNIIMNGFLGIGTTNPTYPLSVNGTIRSKKVIVNTGWSDFVFEDDYNLMPLHKLEKFISKNKHLPEIPSAKEVEENGISLGDMDASLLQKIEELTLYVIELQKQVDELKHQQKESQQ